MKLKIVLILSLCMIGFIGWWNYSLNFGVFSSSHSLKSLPVIRTEAGGTVWNERFYIVGGIGPWAQTLTSFMEFDPAINDWRALPDLPEKISHTGVVARNGKIYVVGGFGTLGFRPHGFMLARWRPRDTLYVFDILQNQWTQGPAMPEPRGAGGIALAQDAIWYVGGIGPNLLDSADLFRFDLVTHRWQKMTAMPTPRDHLRMEAVGSKLYAISGRKDDFMRDLNITECYDILSGKWTRLADIPNGRGGIGSAVKEGMIYVFGGEYLWNCSDEVDRYDPIHDRWDVLAPLPVARHGIIAGLMKDGIHLVSGGTHPRISASGIHDVYLNHCTVL